MTEHQPWWKRKRWWALAVLWLVLAYMLSVGPLYYVGRRYGLPRPLELMIYPALHAVGQIPNGWDQPFHDYIAFWWELAALE